MLENKMSHVEFFNFIYLNVLFKISENKILIKNNYK